MPKVPPNRRDGAGASSVLIEAEGRILRLVVHAGARAQDATATVQVFTEESRVVLNREDLDRLVTALRGRI